MWQKHKITKKYGLESIKINFSQQTRQQTELLGHQNQPEFIHFCRLSNGVHNGPQRYIVVQSKPSKTLYSIEVRRGLNSDQTIKTSWKFNRRIL